MAAEEVVAMAGVAMAGTMVVAAPGAAMEVVKAAVETVEATVVEVVSAVATAAGGREVVEEAAAPMEAEMVPVESPARRELEPTLLGR